MKLHEYAADPKPVLIPIANLIDVKLPSKGMITKTKVRAVVSYQGAWAGAFEGPRVLHVIETLDEIMSLVNKLKA